MNLNRDDVQASRSSLFDRNWLQLLLLTLLGLAAYSNSFQVPFVLDDNYSIQFFGKSSIGELLFNGGARRIADVTFAINYKIHGTSLPGYHITNLAIHLLSAFTLYHLIKSALGTPDGLPDNGATFTGRFVPLAAALLFVAHPLQTQAVTYTIQRYTSLATLFYLFSALAFIRFRCGLESRQSPARVWSWALLTLVSGLLAFGTKQIAATLPVMLIVLEYILFNGRFLTRRFMLAGSLILLLVPAFLLFQWFNGTLGDFLYDLRHATSDDQFMPRGTYFITQICVVATYLRLLILPVNQNLFYDYPTYKSLLAGPVLASLTLHICLAGGALYMLILSRRSSTLDKRDVTICLRLAALGIVWFYLALAVESSIVPIRDVIFEHRAYLPSAGIFMTVCALTALAVRNRPSFRLSAWITLSAICLTLGIATFSRNQVWGNALTIWQDTARKSPNKGLVLANLAAEHLKLGQADKALPLYMRAIELSPNLDFRVKAGLGVSMQALRIYEGRFTTGHEYILAGGTFNSGVLNYGRFNEWEAVLFNNRALAYEYFGQKTKAWDAYQNAIWINPDYDLAWYNLGLFAAGEDAWDRVNLSITKLKAINPSLAKRLEENLRR